MFGKETVMLLAWQGYFRKGQYPSFLSELNPDEVIVGDLCTSNDDVVVHLAWYGHIASWGVIIGSNDIELEPRGYEYSLKVADQVYLWFDEHPYKENGWEMW